MNEDLKLQGLSVGEDGRFQSLQMSFSKLVSKEDIDENPVVSKKGLVVGPEYYEWVRAQGVAVPERQVKATMLRMTLVTREPLLKEGLATFVLPPGSFSNAHPIRIYQQNELTQATPGGFHLLLLSTLEGDNDWEPFRTLLDRFFGLPFQMGEQTEGESAHDSDVLFAAVYKQDYHRYGPSYSGQILFLEDTPFDADIDD